jgi:hypothetical protein
MLAWRSAPFKTLVLTGVFGADEQMGMQCEGKNGREDGDGDGEEGFSESILRPEERLRGI